MQKPGEGEPDSESRRRFLKQTFASLFVPRKLLEIGEITVPTLVSHIRNNIQAELLQWFLDSECDFDFFSMILLKGAKIPLEVPDVSNEVLRAKAQSFLREYDSSYAVLDKDPLLSESEKTEEGKQARKLRRFLATMIDNYEDDHGKIFKGTKKIITSKRKKILQALKVLPKKLSKKLKGHQFWIDESSGSHLKDFQKQFLVEVLKDQKGTEGEPITDEDYNIGLRKAEPLLQDIVDNERSPGHYHERYILEARLEKAAREYSSGKWGLNDLKNVPGFLQAVFAILSEEELIQ